MHMCLHDIVLMCARKRVCMRVYLSVCVCTCLCACLCCASKDPGGSGSGVGGTVVRSMFRVLIVAVSC